jgi:hypothetical protein
MGRLCIREKYLKIEKDTHELPYGILTLLSEEPRSAELIKEKNRDEGEFKVFNKITSPIPSVGKDFNLTISSNSSSRIF